MPNFILIPFARGLGTDENKWLLTTFYSSKAPTTIIQPAAAINLSSKF